MCIVNSSFVSLACEYVILISLLLRRVYFLFIKASFFLCKKLDIDNICA